MKPLTPRQQRAAALVGHGWMKKRVADEVGVHARTLSTWLHREDFGLLVRRARDSVVAQTPTAETTLEAALAATNGAGAPDWRTRVAAARALIGADARGPDEPERETSIFTQHLDGS